MEKYDPGLVVIAQAQAARDAGDKQGAHELFVKGIEELLKLTREDTDERIKALVKKHVVRFMAEAEELLGIVPPSPTASRPASATKTSLKRAEMLERNGREEQRKLSWQKAWKLYAEAAETYQKYGAEVEGNEELTKQAAAKTLEMVEKAEHMMRLVKNPLGKPAPVTSAAAQAESELFSLMPSPPSADDAASLAGLPPKPMADILASTPEGGLSYSLINAFVTGKQKSEEERKVLISGAKINGKLYEPLYPPDTDVKNFMGIGEFRDPDGMPRLDPKQKDKGAVWGRPSQFLAKPTVIKDFTYHCIRQTLVGDCSFVSSLAVCASWEHRYQKALISRNIYPQDANRVPIISPSGRYVVKMFLNGCVRGIVIDDFFPVVKDTTTGVTQMVCTYSKHADELWVSLFEKAYMKLHGGYDFPGSTSSTDLHALCGWIPETFSLDPEKVKDGAPTPEECWFRMKLAHSKGTALFTMGTKKMSEVEETRTGLIGAHAYAVLDVAEELGQKLVKLKNPWAQLRWKGDYSPGDEKHWTPELRKVLRYNAEAEKEIDDGIFWISWEAIKKFFSSVHGSWSPSRFTQRKMVHGYLNKKAPDKLHMDHNPQYHLRVRASRDSQIWLLLIRHYQETAAEPFCCFHVYKGNRRVLVHSEEQCVVRSTYTSTPNCLVRLSVPKGDSSYMLVASLYEDTGILPFTLTSYAVEPHSLLVGMDCPYVEAQPGGLPGGGQKQTWMARWDAGTAGGSINTDSFDVNPQFKIQITGAGPQVVFIKVEPQGKGDKSVGIHLFHGGIRCHRRTCQGLLMKPQLPSTETKYTQGFAWAEFSVGAGSYTFVAATFEKGECGEFSVTVRTRNPLFVSTIPFSPPPPPAAEPSPLPPAYIQPPPPPPSDDDDVPVGAPAVPSPRALDDVPNGAPPAPANGVPPAGVPPPAAPPSTLEGILSGPKPPPAPAAPSPSPISVSSSAPAPAPTTPQPHPSPHPAYPAPPPAPANAFPTPPPVFQPPPGPPPPSAKPPPPAYQPPPAASHPPPYAPPALAPLATPAPVAPPPGDGPASGTPPPRSAST